MELDERIREFMAREKAIEEKRQRRKQYLQSVLAKFGLLCAIVLAVWLFGFLWNQGWQHSQNDYDKLRADQRAYHQSWQNTALLIDKFCEAEGYGGGYSQPLSDFQFGKTAQFDNIVCTLQPPNGSFTWREFNLAPGSLAGGD